MAHVLKSSFGSNVVRSISQGFAAVYLTASSLAQSFAKANENRHMLESMYKMSDRQLDDRFGITRDEIVSFVFKD